MTNELINQSQLAGAAAVACSDLLGTIILNVRPSSCPAVFQANLKKTTLLVLQESPTAKMCKQALR
jgi:hypothetical protein